MSEADEEPLTDDQELDTVRPMPRKARPSAVREQGAEYNPELPEPGSPEELALACMQGPPKRRRDWRYLQEGKKPE